MNTAVCRSVVGRLQHLARPALHAGSLALNLPPAHYRFDDLHLLIREDWLQPFRDAMEAGERGFHLVQWDAATGGATIAPPAVINSCLYGQPVPLTPHLGYSDGPSRPCTLWIQFYTNWRHGPLLLVDLAEWFPVPPAQVMPVAVLGPPPANLIRPPLWALLLWQASLVTNCAADRPDPAVITAELDKLYAIANQLSATDWNTLVQKAQAYDSQYLGRLERIRPTIEAYAAARGVPFQRLIASPGVAAADLDYGVLYDLRYALEALEACYPGTVPGQVAAAVGRGTGARPRKVWNYPPGAAVGELGVTGTSIHDQIQLYPALAWHVEIANAPPQGYWQNLPLGEFQAIWAPWP